MTPEGIERIKKDLDIRMRGLVFTKEQATELLAFIELILRTRVR